MEESTLVETATVLNRLGDGRGEQQSRYREFVEKLRAVPVGFGATVPRLSLLPSGSRSVRKGGALFPPGVKDFVKFGDRIADVADEVVRALMDRCPGGVAEIRMRPYRAGESIIIREGPLSGLEAVFEREMKGNERVAVLLELLGRQTRLVLSREMIARV